MRNVNRTGIITIIALAALALLLPGACATQTVDVDAAIDDRFERADVTVTQSWTDAEAAKFRQSLDVLFGNSDGALTSAEVGQIVDSSEKDVMNKTFPMIAFDGQISRVERVDIVFENVENSVESTTPLTTRHTLALALQAGGNESRHELTVAPVGNGTLRLDAPEGWTIEGGEESVPLRKGQTATVVLVSADGAGGNESAEEAGGEGRGVPAPGLAGALAGAFAAAGLAALRARRRRT